MKLGLGTAQFGLDYGVSNRAGRVPALEVRRILARAARSGVSILDTAHLYGDSERVIGETLPADASFRIVTKTPRFDSTSITPADADRLEATVAASRDHLKRDRLDAVLIHHAPDAFAPGGERLFDRLLRLKQRGWIGKIGVSVYGPEQLERIIELHPIELAQVPFNIVDQRLRLGAALGAKLRQRRIEVHLRSAFLQGLLLMDPSTVDLYFNPWRPKLVEIRRRAEEANLSPLALALRFALDLPIADTVVVGACSEEQLKELIAASQDRRALPDLADLAESDEALINPGRWCLRPR